MNIAFDANPLMDNKSGVGYYTENLISSLCLENSDDSFIGYYSNFLGRKDTSQLLKAQNIAYRANNIVPTKLLNMMRRLGIQAPLSFFVGSKVDIALFTNYIPLSTKKRTMKVVFIYDLCFIDNPDFVQERNRTFLKKWVPRSITTADLIITISEFTKNRIIDNYNVEPSRIFITQIPPPVNSQQDDSIYSDSIVPNEYLLFVGTIEPRKNILGLLEEYKTYYDHSEKPLNLVLAGGKGWKDQEIHEKINDLRTNKYPVVTPGYVSDSQKASLYKGALLCVMPSHYEGFGMPILEAMSFGKPVVVSDIDVFREVGGDAVKYFNKDETGSLTNALESLLTNPKELENYAKKSKEHVDNFPKWSHVAQNLSSKLSSMFDA